MRLHWPPWASFAFSIILSLLAWWMTDFLGLYDLPLWGTAKEFKGCQNLPGEMMTSYKPSGNLDGSFKAQAALENSCGHTHRPIDLVEGSKERRLWPNEK